MKRAFLILLPLFILGIGCSDTSSQTDRCTKNEECTNPEKPICKIGVCVAQEVEVECTVNADCENAEKPVCKANICIPENVECTKNSDCTDPSKTICENNVCVAEVETPECETHVDCTDEQKFMCKDQKCIDPSADFTPENYKIIVKSADETYTEEELEALKQRVEYGFLRKVGKKDKEFSFGTNFNPNNKNILRVPIHNANAGVRYAFSVDFRDSKYDFPVNKSKNIEKNKQESIKDVDSIQDGKFTVSFQGFETVWPDEPRLRVRLHVQHSSYDENYRVYYGVLKKNTASGAGYTADETKLGHYDFTPEGSIEYFASLFPSSSGSQVLKRDTSNATDLPAPKTNGEEYYFVAFVLPLSTNLSELSTVAETKPVLVKKFTTFYEESEFESLEKPIILSFTPPEAMEEPSLTAEIEIPESMRGIENLHLQWANTVGTMHPNGDYTYYPSDDYLKSWGYYFSGTPRGQKNVATQTSTTVTIPSLKIDGQNTNIIFWFSKGTQNQNGHVNEVAERHTRITKKSYTTRFNTGSVEATEPEFSDSILNCVTASQFQKDGEMLIKVEFTHPFETYELFDKNTITWTPIGPDGKNTGESEYLLNIGFLYGTYPFTSPNHYGEDDEPDWTNSDTMGGISDYFYPQITYTFTSSNVLKNGNTASATRDYRANYKGCSEGKELGIPAMTFFPDATPLDLENKNIDLAWTNPADIDIYEIRISWTETNPNPNIEPKHGEIIIQRYYNFNEETGKLIYGEEPAGTITGGQWSDKKEFLEVTAY